MKLSETQLQEIASLARLVLNRDQLKQYDAQISEVIDYNAKQLQKISQIKPRVKKTDRLGQDDLPRPSLLRDLALSNAPEQENGLFVVPKVLE